ncbi:hypothetical protein AKJ09_01520 [Labilithrix luteola]|uniref:Type IV fimbrial biogenesis protein PilY1 n=1 Tax=Labilithrix luteola TaxID=1391654 RepID=A0A0K1PN88_9BACT|nr:hypothetical protein AKJ09_01520 [Labilithrix luteola]
MVPEASAEAASDADASRGDAGGDADADVRTCSNDGFCHTELPAKSWLADVWGDGTGIVWAVGADDKTSLDAGAVLLRWDGKAWTKQTLAAKRLSAIWGSGPTDLWVGGRDGLYHGTGATSDSLTWTKVRGDAIVSLWGSGANDVWAASSTNRFSFDGKILHYAGAGSGGADGWDVDPISSRPMAFRKVWGTSAADVWIGGNEDNGCSANSVCNNGAGTTALHRLPDGTWSQAGSPTFETTPYLGSELTAVRSVTPNDVWIAGSDATNTASFDAYFRGKSKTDGFDWAKGTLGTCFGQVGCANILYTRAIWGARPDDVYLGGDSGQLRHWDGTRMTLMTLTLDALPSTASLMGMWGKPGDDLWIVGSEIALRKSLKVSP